VNKNSKKQGNPLKLTIAKLRLLAPTDLTHVAAGRCTMTGGTTTA
jgi:hypothetical protein